MSYVSSVSLCHSCQHADNTKRQDSVTGSRWFLYKCKYFACQFKIKQLAEWRYYFYAHSAGTFHSTLMLLTVAFNLEICVMLWIISTNFTSEPVKVKSTVSVMGMRGEVVSLYE